MSYVNFSGCFVFKDYLLIKPVPHMYHNCFKDLGDKLSVKTAKLHPLKICTGTYDNNICD